MDNLSFDRDSNTYATTDFYSAVTLRTYGFRLIAVEQRGRGKSWFIFENNAKDMTAEEVLQDYWDRLLQLDARTFVDNINELKTRLYSVKNDA